MLTWEEHRRPRMWYGWTDLGPIQIPTMPQYIIMTDRTTGNIFCLGWNGDGNNNPITPKLGGTIPTTPNQVTYGPFDGPYLRATVLPKGGSVPQLIRLLSSGNGNLSFETLSFDHEVDRECQQVFGVNPDDMTRALLITYNGTSLVYQGYQHIGTAFVPVP